MEKWEKIKPRGTTAVLLLSPLVVVFLLETLNWGSLSSTVVWMLIRPQIVLINYILITLLMTTLFFLTKRLWLVNLVFCTLALSLSCLNYFKIFYRSDPLYFEDIYLVREMLDITNSNKLLFPPVIVPLILMILATVIGGAIFNPRLLELKVRLKPAGILALTQLIIIANIWLWFPQFSKAMDLDYISSGNQVASYFTNGMLLGFLAQAHDGQIIPPTSYSHEMIAQLQASAEDKNFPEASSCSSLSASPLVIVIMNESWADPTKLPGLTFANDPLINYHRLQQEAESGQLLVKTIGGGTAESEFEVLTGMSNSFHPPESTAYVKYIRRPTPSLIHQAKLAGFVTTAIHPYYGWFWRRENVYPLLGFDNLVFSEDLNITPDQLHGDLQPHHSFLADDSVGDLIINYAASASAQPQFIWAVTMQNHGSYLGELYDVNDYQLVAYTATPSADLSADDHQQLANYFIGLRDGDLLLGKLVEKYRDDKQPVVIVFFGDHWGEWGEARVWKQLKGVSEEEKSATNITDFHTTPYLIWNNLAYSEQVATNSGIISGWNLTTKIMKKACLPTTPYYQFITQQAKVLPAYNLGINYRPDGSVVWDQELNEQEQQAKANHWLWQYDLLMGDNYSGWNQNNDEGV